MVKKSEAMKIYYIGVILVIYFTYASASRPERFSDYDPSETNEWNWISKDQLADAQTPQVSWPRSGSGGSVKGKGDSNPNRDGTWAQDNWPSGGNRNDAADMVWDTQPQGNNKGSAYPDGNEDQGGDLETILRGVPGMDFPNFVTLPDTDFDCSSMPSQGYYGDVEAGCQVFHICQPGNRKDSFLCPVGTIFNQKYFVCDWWFNVNCSDTPSYYELNNEVYKDPVTVTEEVPVTTEKSMPWNSPDLDRKKPTKGWGNQPPSTGKQNPNWKGTPSRRGSKSSGSVSTSREVSNTWSRSDVQKEITLSWGASSSSPSETYASSAAPSNSVTTPTMKPIWYGIDGQPAKDQTNKGVSKRVGLIQTSAPFGTRIRKKKDRVTAMPNESTIQPPKPNIYKSTTSNVGTKLSDTDWASATIGSWQKNDDVTVPVKEDVGITWNNDVDYDYPTTKTWLKGKDIPETSINPTDIEGVWEQQTKKDAVHETSINPTEIKGVWEQQSTKRVDSESTINPTRIKEVWKQQATKRRDSETSVNPPKFKSIWKQQSIRQPNESQSFSALKNRNFNIKFDQSMQNPRIAKSTSKQRKQWNQRRKFRNMKNSTPINRGRVQSNSRNRKAEENSKTNSIPRHQN